MWQFLLCRVLSHLTSSAYVILWKSRRVQVGGKKRALTGLWMGPGYYGGIGWNFRKLETGFVQVCPAFAGHLSFFVKLPVLGQDYASAQV